METSLRFRVLTLRVQIDGTKAVNQLGQFSQTLLLIFRGRGAQMVVAHHPTQIEPAKLLSDGRKQVLSTNLDSLQGHLALTHLAVDFCLRDAVLAHASLASTEGTPGLLQLRSSDF